MMHFDPDGIQSNEPGAIVAGTACNARIGNGCAENHRNKGRKTRQPIARIQFVSVAQG